MVNSKKLNKDQTGLASFLVTLIMMIVISLIVLGFAQLARREQRESLDNQLSAAAYYAAESGVNDAVKAVQDGYTGSKTTCPPDSTVPDLSNSSVGGGSSYTCLLINSTPNQLMFQDVAQNASTITQLQTTSNPSKLTITWKNVTGTTTNYGGCPAVGVFKSSWPTGANCGAGILRIDLVPANALGNSSNLQGFAYTAFLVPHNGSGGGAGSTSLPAQIIANPPTSTIPTGSNGVVLPASCSGSACSESITNIDTATTVWYLRMTSVYNDSNVTITATTGGTSWTFQNGQIDIDSTGKANDVLKRILVAVPYSGTIDDTPFAIQTTDSLCKHFYITSPSVAPTYVAPSASGFDDTSCYGK